MDSNNTTQHSHGGVVDIKIEHLNMRKFYGYSTGGFLFSRFLMFPLQSIKTRQQVSTVSMGKEMSTMGLAKQIYKNEGVTAFFRGFGTQALGVMPAQMAYITTIETIRSGLASMGAPVFIQSGVAGACASFVSQLFGCPIDIISQRLMIQGEMSKEQAIEKYGKYYKNGRDVARQIWRTEGFWGFYRGYSAAVMTYAPTSALWWGIYGVTRKYGIEFMYGDDVSAEEISMWFQPVLGMLSGSTVAVLTNPLDIVKSRLQTQAGNRASGFVSTMVKIVKEEGSNALLRGVNARVLNMAITGAVMLSMYEWVKRLALRDEFR